MTNREYIKAIDMRRSRRTYKNQPLDGDTKQVIKSLVDIVNKNHGLQMIFIDDPTPAFKLLTGKFSAIALCGDDSEKSLVKSGYYGESIVLQCVYHGLGTCWVSGTYDENKILEIIKIPKKTRLYGLIVIGYVKDALSAKEKMIYSFTHKKNKPYQKMIEACDEKLPPYYVEAMRLVEKAPSGVNERPVKFRYENGVMSAYVENPYSEKSLDLGIAQLHFCLGSASMGVKGEWDFKGRFCTEDAKKIKFPQNNTEENENE